jgi:hypothetical protein
VLPGILKSVNFTIPTIRLTSLEKERVRSEVGAGLLTAAPVLSVASLAVPYPTYLYLVLLHEFRPNSCRNFT